ncbi:phosphotransferase [Tenacibaculum aiptasiae]|uniref:Phosphotransferase n=1 Tax=Tenacibaculum aiptasiae TaxID=426481 RepID=A0A7J5APC2_9FLAO|nr:phosphotransferase [Tenacibaculum aiptasiae]KAB1159466.1 phosphotransferase [Tenacibaculum aiptasiae]
MEQQTLDKILKHFTRFTLKTYKELEKGVMTTKYVLTGFEGSNEKKFIVRVFPKGREFIMKYEPKILQEAHEKKIKVPKLIGSSNEYPVSNLSYIIYEYLPGRPLNEIYDNLNKKDKNIIISEIVDNIFNLSKIKCNNFGPLENELTAKHNCWEEFLIDSYKNSEIYLTNNKELKNDLLKHYNFSLIKGNNNKEKLNNLVWLDFHPENIIINDLNRLEGFIDFEEVISGDLKMALGYLYAREGSSDFFNEVYKEYLKKDNTITIKKIEEYSFIRICRIAPYLNLDLPSGKKRDPLLNVFKGIKEINLRFNTNLKKYKSFLNEIFFIEENTEKRSNNQQKIRAAMSLFWFSIIIVIAFLTLFNIELDRTKIYNQTWNNTEKISLKYANAPVWFKHQDKNLYSDVVISDKMKQQLYKLASDSLPRNNSYFKAVNSLTFDSRQNAPNTLAVIFACGLLSILGVSIRSMWDFVGNASYKNDLNLNRWWPWYFLRPLIGFLAGICFYFLFNAGILELKGTGVTKSKLYLLLGLTTLIGFGLNDFIERLRLISKAMFGSDSKK